jgi:drug/metabolite transporter (DMT)-like permease
MPTKLLILIVTINAVIGQILLKRALVSLGGPAAFASLLKFIFAAMKSPWIYLSLAIQVFGYVLWMTLVSREKLGVAAASVGAGFYVLMALGGWVVYGESLTLVQWLGIGFITIGVTCVSMNAP